MQRTEKYFEQDAFRTQCESTILAAEPDEKTGGGRIALDGTVFYPEGGGQPADRGTLTLPDGATLNVTDVHEHDGILWHSVDALPESAVPGTAVSGCIDWEWRFDKMQQHRGTRAMQRTEKYFEQDAFRTQCESTILAAEPDEKTGGGRIALDGTVFYPEGGGQPADRGTLTLPDGATLNVTDVHEHDGILWHSVDALPESAVPGTAVSGCIDWEWRFDKMQQHTGEHILSGILHQMFGAENVGFHIGSEAVRMDTSVPISAEGLQAAELAANRIVWQDVPVLVSYPTREELAALVYRSKKEIEGQVRIVTIPGADVCACCGTHTRTTGQVGQIKILASENYKGGVRLSVVCGARALEAAQAMRARQADIGALLSAKADQTAVAVHRVYDEYTALKFTHFGVCSQLFDALAQLANPGEDAIRTVPGLDPDGLHRLAVRLTEATTGLCAALTPTEKGTGYCIAQADGDVRALTKALNAALNGRGGGKPGICQGSCAAAPEQVEAFLREQK